MTKRLPASAPRLPVTDCVLDASAIVALLRRETGCERVAELVSDPAASMSTVNLSEVVAKLAEDGLTAGTVRESIDRLQLKAIPFDAEAAFQAGFLRPLTRHLGLSLGDRACLALAQRLGLPAVTADRSWTALQLPVTVQVIR